MVFYLVKDEVYFFNYKYVDVGLFFGNLYEDVWLMIFVDNVSFFMFC